MSLTEDKIFCCKESRFSRNYLSHLDHWALSLSALPQLPV